MWVSALSLRLSLVASKFNSIGYPLRIRQKALAAILMLLKPLDAWSFVLLDSGLIEFTTTSGFEFCEDLLIRKTFADLLHILLAYCSLHCRCITCIRALRVSHAPTICCLPDPQLILLGEQVRLRSSTLSTEESRTIVEESREVILCCLAMKGGVGC